MTTMSQPLLAAQQRCKEADERNANMRYDTQDQVWYCRNDTSDHACESLCGKLVQCFGAQTCVLRMQEPVKNAWGRDMHDTTDLVWADALVSVLCKLGQQPAGELWVKHLAQCRC